MKIKKLHKWNVSYSKAIELQKKLAGEVQFRLIKTPPKLIAGLDCAFSTDGQRIIACVILLRWPDLEIIETKQAVRKLLIWWTRKKSLELFEESQVVFEK